MYELNATRDTMTGWDIKKTPLTLLPLIMTQLHITLSLALLPPVSLVS